MATRTRKLDIEIGSETKGDGFTKADKDLDKLGDKLRKTGDEGGRGLAQGIEQGTDKLASKLRNFGEKAGEDINSGIKGGVGKIGSTLESAGSNAGDLFASGFDPSAVVDVLASGLGSSSGKLGTAAAGLGVAAGAAFAFGLISNMDIEAANDKLAAQLDLSAQQSEAFGNAAGELYANAYGDSIEQVNDALGAVHSSLGGFIGDSEDALVSATAKALDFATAFEQDVVEAAGIAGFAIQHGLARDSDHAWDLMVTAMQRMPASMRQELFPAIEEYGGFLHNLGFTGEQAFGLLAAASAEGSFGIDKTADALKELTIRATDMSTLSVASFEAAGLNADEMAARFLEGGASARGALDDLIAGLLAIEDPVARSNAAIGLFGTPLEDLSVTEIPAFLEGLSSMSTDLGNVAGAADEMGDVLNDNAKTKIEAFRRQALMKLTDFVGNKVIPQVEEWKEKYGDDLARAYQNASKWVEDHMGVVKAFGVVAAAVLSLLVVHWAATAAAAVASAVVHGTQVAFMIAKYIALGVAALASGAQMALAWLIGLGPIALVIAGIAALAALVIIHFDTIKGAISTVFNWVRDNWPLLLAILTGPIGLAVLAIVSHWETIKNAFTTVKDWIGDRVGDIVGFFTDLPGRIASAVSGLWEPLKGGLVGIINWAIDKLNGLLDGIDKALGPFINLPSIPHIGSDGGRGRGGRTFQHGGIVPGIGIQPILAHGGELVLNPAQQANTLMAIAEGAPLDSGSSRGGGDTYIVNVYPQGHVIAGRELIAEITEAVSTGHRIRDRGRVL